MFALVLPRRPATGSVEVCLGMPSHPCDTAADTAAESAGKSLLPGALRTSDLRKFRQLLPTDVQVRALQDSTTEHGRWHNRCKESGVPNFCENGPQLVATHSVAATCQSLLWSLAYSPTQNTELQITRTHSSTTEQRMMQVCMPMHHRCCEPPPASRFSLLPACTAAVRVFICCDRWMQS